MEATCKVDPIMISDSKYTSTVLIQPRWRPPARWDSITISDSGIDENGTILRFAGSSAGQVSIEMIDVHNSLAPKILTCIHSLSFFKAKDMPTGNVMRQNACYEVKFCIFREFWE